MTKVNWRSMNSAPTNGDEFLATINNGWIVILHAGIDIQENNRYGWWQTAGNRFQVPHEPSHGNNVIGNESFRAIAWAEMPVAYVPGEPLEE